MTSEPLISVIVPVYNVERYLDQCMESIVGQSYPHLEILVVDDGSTDGSGELCDRWAGRDERIRVIHQPNGGLSAARNTALDAMTGEWVIMVDSDDVLHHDAASILLEAILREQADIVIGDHVIVYDDAAPQWPAGTHDGDNKNAAYSQQDALLAVFYQQGLTHSAWARIYRAALFDDIRYPVGKLYEDLAIIYPLLKKCDKIVKIEQVVYGYRQRRNSILGSFSPRRADVLEICEKLEKDTSLNDSQYCDAVRSRLLSAYFNILLLSNQDKSTDHQALQDRCWEGIRQRRGSCLFNPRVRLKNKLGILVSYLGRHALCSVIGRNYRPRP